MSAIVLRLGGKDEDVVVNGRSAFERELGRFVIVLSYLSQW